MSGGVVNGQAVSAEVTNPAFIYKNDDDSTSFKLSFLDTIGVGTAATDNTKIEVDASTIPAMQATSVSASIAAEIILRRAQAANANLNADDVICDILIKGMANSSYNSLGKIDATYKGNGTTFDTDMNFYVGLAAALNLKMTLKSNGNLLVGTSTDGGQTIQANGSIYGTKYASAVTSQATTGVPITALSSTNGVVFFTGSTATTVQGISAPTETASAGTMLFVQNSSSANITFKNQDGSASAANRIILPSATDYTLAADSGVIFVYDQTNTRWRIVDSTEFSFATFGSSPTASGASVSGTVVTLQPADATHGGGVSILAQTYAGQKTFNSAPILSSLTASRPLKIDASNIIVATQIDLSSPSDVSGVLANANTTATSANTASTIISRDGSGNFSAGTITAALTGNATTATTATNATNVATTAIATNASFFPLFVASSSNSNQASNLDADLTYNPSTNTLTATTVVAALTGTASGNTTISGQTNHGVVVASATNAMTSTAAGTTGQVLTSNGASADPTFQDAGVGATNYSMQKNYLSNSQFRFFQRQDATTLTNVADAALGPDRWRVLNSGAVNMQSARVAETVNNQTTTIAQFRQANATARQFGAEQIIPNGKCLELRGKTVNFNVWARTDTTEITTLRMGIVEWTGTSDSVTADIVSSWSSTPTLIANATFINTPADITISSSMAQISVTATLGTTFNNLVMFIWTPNTEAQNDDFYLAQGALVEGSSVVAFEKLSLDFVYDEIDSRQYYQKTYALDTAPASATSTGRESVNTFSNSIPDNVPYTMRYFVPVMFNSPTITIYSNNGTSTRVSNSGGTSLAANSGLANQFMAGTEHNFDISNEGGALTTTGTYIEFHWTADTGW